MIIIAHRGNLKGPDPINENKPEYLEFAIDKGFEIEVDVWVQSEKIFLGHDNPAFEINIDFLNKFKSKSWFHAKNIEALEFFTKYSLDQNDLNYFWHENDDYTLTSQGWIWAYPNKYSNFKSIAVLPEIHKTKIQNFSGICTDYVFRYKLND